MMGPFGFQIPEEMQTAMAEQARQERNKPAFGEQTEDDYVRLDDIAVKPVPPLEESLPSPR